MTDNRTTPSLVARFANDYGMIFVLLLLVVVFSSLTIKLQHPTGAAAGRQVADKILKQHGRSARVLIVARNTAIDRQFADGATEQLQAAGATVLDSVNGVAGDAREWEANR